MRPSLIAKAPVSPISERDERDTPPRILIVDDEAPDAQRLGAAVSKYGYELKVVRNSFIALDIAKQWKPQVAILDVKMPGMNGLALSEKLRKYADDPIVIFVTSEASNRMRRMCLRAGDDYIVKPYSGEDLALRVESKLRRFGSAGKNTQGANEWALHTHKSAMKGARPEYVLTPTETRLLSALLAGEGATVSRDKLIQDIWDDEVYDNTLDNTIRRLRMKIEPDPRRPRIIITVRKAGYRIDLAEWRRAHDGQSR